MVRSFSIFVSFRDHVAFLPYSTLSIFSAGINRYVEVYDWLQWRGSFLRASFDSQIVGKKVCSSLAEAEKQQGEIKHLHVIGVSVGAFAADSCIKVFNKVSHQWLATLNDQSLLLLPH